MGQTDCSKTCGKDEICLIFQLINVYERMQAKDEIVSVIIWQY